MDYYAAGRWPDLQPPPQHHHPNPPPYDTRAVPPTQTHHLPLHHHSQNSFAASSYYPNPNANPLPNYGNPSPTVVPAPAVGTYLPYPYAPHRGYSVGPAGAVAGGGGGLAGYYYERLRQETNGSAANEAHRQYDAISYGQVGPRSSYGLDHAGSLHVAPPRRVAKLNHEGGGKKSSNPTKGKKHKTSLQKLQESITPNPHTGPATSHVVVPDDGGTAAGKKQKRKEIVDEDIETKKRKMLESGAVPKEVRVCTICNVVVNSEKVYALHVAGSKHAAMVEKQQGAPTA